MRKTSKMFFTTIHCFHSFVECILRFFFMQKKSLVYGSVQGYIAVIKWYDMFQDLQTYIKAEQTLISLVFYVLSNTDKIPYGSPYGLKLYSTFLLRLLSFCTHKIQALIVPELCLCTFF
jgi:hypothetical protein